MFGMGFTEILMIVIVAVLFLGPDKLPTAMVEVAKFFKKIKTTLNEAKESIEEEIDIGKLKEEALMYKEKLDNASEQLSHINSGDFIKNELEKPKPQVPDNEEEVVTFSKKKKKEEQKNVWWITPTFSGA